MFGQLTTQAKKRTEHRQDGQHHSRHKKNQHDDHQWCMPDSTQKKADTDQIRVLDREGKKKQEEQDSCRPREGTYQSSPMAELPACIASGSDPVASHCFRLPSRILMSMTTRRAVDADCVPPINPATTTNGRQLALPPFIKLWLIQSGEAGETRLSEHHRLAPYRPQPIVRD